ncbi:MAG TPA: hypothetical protein VIV40_16015 [Kofleriaceae bacterium]
MKKICLTLLIGIAACGGKSAPATTTTAPTPPAKTDDPTCPLVVPGTSLSVEDTATGAALVFVTTGDAAAVRTRATALAEMHNKHDGPSGSMGMMFSPSSTAAAKDIEGGSRVEMTAKNAGDVAKLQGELRMHAGHLTGGSCEM